MLSSTNAVVTYRTFSPDHIVLAGRDVEPGFARMGEAFPARTPANKPLDDRLLDTGAGRMTA
jgi:hypothetical protein